MESQTAIGKEGKWQRHIHIYIYSYNLFLSSILNNGFNQQVFIVKQQNKLVLYEHKLVAGEQNRAKDTELAGEQNHYKGP